MKHISSTAGRKRMQSIDSINFAYAEKQTPVRNHVAEERERRRAAAHMTGKEKQAGAGGTRSPRGPSRAKALTLSPRGFSGASASTLCWHCQNAVPDADGERGCSWSREGKPVAGWEAEIRPLNLSKEQIISYCVRSCPEFFPDKEVRVKDCAPTELAALFERLRQAKAALQSAKV